MRCSRDHFSVEAAAMKGRDLPDWYLDEPEILTGDHFYLQAFKDLHTCRAIGMSMGPIPWRDIIYYGQFSGLEPDVLSCFIYIIRTMDDGYLQWIEENKDKP